MYRKILRLFPKKTKEQKIQFRVDEVLLHIIKSSDFTFTELETVQILNNVKLKLGEHLIAKQNDCLQKSKQYDEKADEIKNAMDSFE